MTESHWLGVLSSLHVLTGIMNSIMIFNRLSWKLLNSCSILGVL